MKPCEEQFGPYTLLHRIATGGMGELCLARRRGSTGFSKPLVLKRLRAELADDAEFVEMFVREGRVTSLLDHPNIVHVYESGQVDGTYFMAMEYVAGRHLGEVLRRQHGPLPLAEATYLLAGVCEGLAFAHEAVDDEGRPLALVHRDVNPSNVLVSFTGAVKIADFGLAKVQAAHHRATRAGVVKGKFGYLSPEQAKALPLDRRTDIYALGLLLFEVTTGESALTGASEDELVRAATQGLIRDPCHMVSDYPKALQTIFRKATAFDPLDRYPSARHMQEELLAFQMDKRLVGTAGKLAKLVRDLFADEWVAEERFARTPVNQPMLRPRTGSTHGAGPATAARQHMSREPTLEAIAVAASSEHTSSGWPNTPIDLLLRKSPEVPRRVPSATQVLGEMDTSVYHGHNSEILALTDALGRRHESRGAARASSMRRKSRRFRKTFGALVAIAIPVAALYLFVVNPSVWTLPQRAVPGKHVGQHAPAQQAKLTAVDAGSRWTPDSGGVTLSAKRKHTQEDALAESHESSQHSHARGAPRPPAQEPRTQPASHRLRRQARAVASGEGQLSVEATPELTVTWDNDTLGNTPLLVSLPAGQHHLTLENRELSIRIHRRVTIFAGKTNHVVFKPRKGLLRVDAPPQTRVTLRGEHYGVTPMPHILLYQGLYPVELFNEKLKATHRQYVRIRPGRLTTLPWHIQPLGAPSKPAESLPPSSSNPASTAVNR